MRNRLATVRTLVALLACAAAAAQGNVAREPRSSVLPASTRSQSLSVEGHAWWLSFQDSTLNLLMAIARSGAVGDAWEDFAVEVDVTQRYVQARTYSLRMVTTRALGSAAARRLELSLKSGEESEDRTSWLRQKTNDATQRSKEFEKLRTESIALLARHVRAEAQETQVLATLLAPALGNTLLPLPMIQIEGELPGAVLRQRPDVARAEAQLVQAGRSSSADRLRFAGYVQAISASIEPLAGGEPTEATGQESDDLEHVVFRARREVGRGLWQLRTQAQAAQAQRLLVRRLNDTYAAQHGQFLEGRIEEAQVLDTLIQLLEEEDRLAATAGAVAMAWIAIEYSTGGGAASAAGYSRATLHKTEN